MKTTLVCLLGLLCLWCGVHSTPEECSRENVQQRQLQCFQQFNVTFGGESAQDVQSAIQSNPAAICSNIDAYNAAVTCSFNIAQDCLRSVGEPPAVLPHPDRVVEGMIFLCRHRDDLNTECSNLARPRITMCTSDRQPNVTELSVAETTCAIFNVTYNCMKDFMGHCGQRNLELNLEFTNEFYRPPACDSFDPDGNDYPREEPTVGTLAPQVVTGMVADNQSLELLLKVAQCFEQAGVAVDPQDPSVLDIFHTVQFDENLTYAVCRDKSKYMQAFTCVFEVTKQYLPSETRKYLPEPSSIAAFYDDLCDYADKRFINFTCTTSKVTEYRNCSLRKKDERMENDSEIARACQGLYLEIECHKEILEECGCRTSHLFIKVFKGLNPPTCPAITIPIPNCDPVTEDYSTVATGGDNVTGDDSGETQTGDGNGAMPVQNLSSFLTVSVALLLGSFARF